MRAPSAFPIAPVYACRLCRRCLPLRGVESRTPAGGVGVGVGVDSVRALGATPQASGPPPMKVDQAPQPSKTSIGMVAAPLATPRRRLKVTVVDPGGGVKVNSPERPAIPPMSTRTLGFGTALAGAP